MYSVRFISDLEVLLEVAPTLHSYDPGLSTPGFSSTQSAFCGLSDQLYVLASSPLYSCGVAIDAKPTSHVVPLVGSGLGRKKRKTRNVITNHLGSRGMYARGARMVS